MDGDYFFAAGNHAPADQMIQALQNAAVVLRVGVFLRRRRVAAQLFGGFVGVALCQDKIVAFSRAVFANERNIILALAALLDSLLRVFCPVHFL
jgi:hypothetical protein